MSESRHTREPWAWDGKPWDYDRDNEAPWIIGFGGPVLTGEVSCSGADARRIVACVNACAGLSTEALEAGALAAVLKSTETLSVALNLEWLKAELRALGRLP